MKKRNLLSLGALVLSLGLTVTSCAGAQGDKGDKGDTGAKGDKGDTGAKGEDGKTYIAVIVDDWKFKGVNVTQDKYFVEPGESVTFQFELSSTSTDKAEVLTSIKFNGTEYLTSYVEANDKGVASWTLTTASTDKGFQMTNAEFGSVESYADGLIDDYLESISDVDHLVGTKSSNNTDVNFAYELVEDFNTSVYGKEAEAKNKIDSKLSALKSDATVADKVKAALEGKDEGIALIKEEYESAIKTAKENAKTTINGDKKVNADYKADDFKADQTQALADVEAASTLEGIAKVVNKTAASLQVADSGTSIKAGSSSFAVGSYWALTDTKEDIIDALEVALKGAIGSDAWMNGTDAQKDNLKSMKEKLASYGVSVDKLPSEVYASYAAEVSAAKTLEKENNKYVLQVNGEKAIKEAYTNVKDELATAIKQSYFDEINNSSVLSSLNDAKSALRAVIETSVSNYVTADENKTTLPISAYLSENYKAPEGEAKDSSTFGDGENKTGLIGYIENNLEKAIAGNNVEAFAQERLDNALADAKSQLLAKAKEYRTSDALYGQVFGEATYFGTTAGVTDIIPTGFKSVDTVITNGSTDKEVKLALPAEWAKKVAATTTVAEHYELGNTGKTLSTEYVAYYQYSTIKSSKETVKEVKAALTTSLTAVKTAYDSAVSALKSSAKSTFVGSTITAKYSTLTGIKNSAVSDAWDKLTTLTSFDAISKAAVSSNTAGSLVTKVDEAVGKYLTDLKKTDADYVYDGAESRSSTNSFFLDNELSSFNDSMNALVEGLVAGTKTSSDVDSFVTASSMKAAYEADVAAWLTKVKDVMASRYAAAYNATSITSTEAGLALKARYDAFIALIGNKVNPVAVESTKECGFAKGSAFDFTGKSITSCNLIDTWFTEAVLNDRTTAGTDSILVKAEKDYVASKFSDVTTGSKPGKVLSDIAGKTIKLTSDTTSLADGKSALAKNTAESFAEWNSDTAANGTYKVDLSSYSLFCSLVDAVYENEGKAGTTVTCANIYLNVKASDADSDNTVDTWTVTGFEGALSVAVDNATYKNELSDSDKVTLKSTLKGYVGSKIWIEIDNLNNSKANAKIVKISTSELKASTISSGHSFAVLDLSSNSSNAAWSELVTAVATNGAVEGATDSDWTNFTFTDYAAG